MIYSGSLSGSPPPRGSALSRNLLPLSSHPAARSPGDLRSLTSEADTHSTQSPARHIWKPSLTGTSMPLASPSSRGGPLTRVNLTVPSNWSSSTTSLSPAPNLDIFRYSVTGPSATYPALCSTHDLPALLSVTQLCPTLALSSTNSASTKPSAPAHPAVTANSHTPSSNTCSDTALELAQGKTTSSTPMHGLCSAHSSLRSSPESSMLACSPGACPSLSWGTIKSINASDRRPLLLTR
mmetsp:Transcript_28773/g.72927  ORF Transcript_28773/g.72927 Transcript_28773/m.72927 type:complete len:238 (+) Transcript_28773:292-1005(+)